VANSLRRNSVEVYEVEAAALASIFAAQRHAQI
jgi:hypothetical protein